MWSSSFAILNSFWASVHCKTSGKKLHSEVCTSSNNFHILQKTSTGIINTSWEHVDVGFMPISKNSFFSGNILACTFFIWFHSLIILRMLLENTPTCIYIRNRCLLLCPPQILTLHRSSALPSDGLLSQQQKTSAPATAKQILWAESGGRAEVCCVGH